MYSIDTPTSSAKTFTAGGKEFTALLSTHRSGYVTMQLQVPDGGGTWSQTQRYPHKSEAEAMRAAERAADRFLNGLPPAPEFESPKLRMDHVSLPKRSRKKAAPTAA